MAVGFYDFTTSVLGKGLSVKDLLNLPTFIMLLSISLGSQPRNERKFFECYYCTAEIGTHLQFSLRTRSCSFFARFILSIRCSVRRPNNGWSGMACLRSTLAQLDNIYFMNRPVFFNQEVG